MWFAFVNFSVSVHIFSTSLVFLCTLLCPPGVLENKAFLFFFNSCSYVIFYLLRCFQMSALHTVLFNSQRPLFYGTRSMSYLGCNLFSFFFLPEGVYMLKLQQSSHFCYSRLRSFFWPLSQHWGEPIIMEFGLKQRNLSSVLLSAVFESCIRKRSETMKKNTDISLKQHV